MNTKLVRKEEVAEGTIAFYWEKPAGFMYEAGQTLDLTLINPPETDAEGNMRTFSIAAAPYEENLMIATRMRDTAFKRTLKNMAEGTEVSFEGPIGSFTLHENAARPAIFLAGGIGITPFRSIVLDAATRTLPHQIYLFYSNRRPEDAPFMDDMQNAAKENTNFIFVPTMTDMEKSTKSWDGEQGYITADMIRKHVPKDTMPIYYLAGPQAMVLALRDVLTGAGVSKDDIRFEEFAGY